MTDELATYTAGVIAARAAYTADMKVQSGLCRHDGCHRKHKTERRQCWTHTHTRGRA